VRSLEELIYWCDGAGRRKLKAQFMAKCRVADKAEVVIRWRRPMKQMEESSRTSELQREHMAVGISFSG
jgi:hypothetical protein